MDGHSAYPHPEPAAREGSRDEMQLPPGGNAEGGQTLVAKFEVEDGLRHQRQHQHHQRQRHQQQQQQQNASAPRPTNTPSAPPPGKSSPGRTVDRLAHKLSRHNLQQLNRANHGQLQAQPTPSSPGLSGLPELPCFQPSAEPDVNDQSQRHLSAVPLNGHISPWVPVWLQDIGEPIEVDDEFLEKPDDMALDVKQSQEAKGLVRAGLTSTRAVDPRLEDMVASGTQCNVHAEPRPTSTPLQRTPRLVPSARPPFIEPDPDCAMPMPDLEVDENAEETSDATRDWVALPEGAISLRYASGPAGIRKYSVGGVALRYQLSADAAMRCANVVRSRPRMRKRTKTRHGSAPSPAVTSAVASPDVSPSALSPALPLSFPPPP